MCWRARSRRVLMSVRNALSATFVTPYFFDCPDATILLTPQGRGKLRATTGDVYQAQEQNRDRILMFSITGDLPAEMDLGRRAGVTDDFDRRSPLQSFDPADASVVFATVDKSEGDLSGCRSSAHVDRY